MKLHYHPLSSMCWKVLIALYEKGTDFEPTIVNLGDAAARDAFVAMWPTGKIPLLEDGDRVVPETSIQIEYIDRRDAGAIRLQPEDPERQLEVRLLDRLFDLYVMVPMQQIVGQVLRPDGERDPRTTEDAHRVLTMAYGMLDARLAGRTWAAGDDFTMADCAAAPALFYANLLQPIGAEHRTLDVYFQALMARPSVQRAIDQARPFFKYYPLQEKLPAEYRDGTL